MFLCLFLLLITGCSVKYNLAINEDLSITEESIIEGSDDLYNTYYKTTKKNILKSLLDIYKTDLDDNNYTYELTEGISPYVTITRKYDSVGEYLNNSKMFNGYFDDIKYTENGNYKRIETIGFNKNESDNQDRFYVEKLTISIKCPYVVTNHNAKNVDKQTNTYYYELSEDSELKVLLEYDISQKYNPNGDIIWIIIISIAIIAIIWFIVFILNKNQKK